MNLIIRLLSVSALFIPISASASEISSRSVVERTEKALLEQVRCHRPPQAGRALQAMLKNKLVKSTGDAADGSVVFAPTRPMRLLGFRLVHITGWQERREGGAMPPFFRGPGTAPPNFIEVTVRGTAAELRRVAAAAGLGGDRPTDAVFQIKDGDTDIAVRKRLRGVATITCMADPQ